MQKIAVLFIAILTACSSSRSIERRPSSEGFYPLAGTERSVDRARKSIGQLFIKGHFKYDARTIKIGRKRFCGDTEKRRWSGELCDELLATRCDKGCDFEAFRPSCSGGKVGNYFVTARHCMPSKTAPMKVKFESDRLQLIEVKLVETSMSHHNLPYDIAILEADPSDGLAPIPSAQIATKESSVNAPVFAIGFPFLDRTLRPIKSRDYDYVSMGERVTYGKVTEPNSAKKSYCRYSNENENAKPESWVLESSCASYDYTKFSYSARKETNVILTDTDMTYGMSGSFLFNADSELIGIGSTVKSSDPGPYSSDQSAIYSKAENILPLLKGLPDRKRD